MWREKNDEDADQAKHSVADSYTIQPVISAYGWLPSPILAVLTEAIELALSIRQNILKWMFTSKSQNLLICKFLISVVLEKGDFAYICFYKKND